MSFTRSAVGALAQLLAVGWVVSVALTLTSGSALANLPAAVLGVYALRVLAQVRLDARWDATTRRLSLSVTRVAPGDPADPSAGSFVAPANGAREGSAAKRAPVPGAASPHPSRDVPSSSPAPPPLHPADREAELRDLLRRFDPPPRDADPSAHGVLGAWSRLRDHIVRDFVLHLWYRSLTRDESFPNDVARLLDAAFVELAHRARRADLHRLFLRVVPDILATQLEHFRDARDACGGVDAYVRLTPTAADRAIATQLRKRGRLHPGVEYANTDMGPDASVADVVALGAARDPAAARLSRACGIAAAALLHVDATTSFAEDATATSMMGIDIGSVAVVSLTREVLATCALRPLLGFASPTWIHRGLAALFAAEDDIAAAEAEAKEETEAKEEEETSPVSKEETSPVEEEETSPVSKEETSPVSSSVSSASSPSEGSSGIAADGVGSVGGDARAALASCRLRARVVEVHIAGKGTSAYAVYTIRVSRSGSPDGPEEWVVPRRFRNFEALHRRLVDAGHAPDLLPQLPKKRYLLHSLDGSFVEARRALLDAYLVALVSDATRRDSPDVREFLSPAPDGATNRYALEPARPDRSSRAGSAGASWGSATIAQGGAATSFFGAFGTPASAEGSPNAEKPGKEDATQKPGRAGAKGPPAPVPAPKHRRWFSSGAVFATDGRSSPVAGARENARIVPAPAPETPTGTGTSGAVGAPPDLDAPAPPDSVDSEDERAGSIGGADDTAETDAQALMNGPLLRLFEAVFHLQAKGTVRRAIVAVARQTLEFFIGAAVEDFVSSRMRALRSPNTVAAVIDLIDRSLWPNGRWYQRGDEARGGEGSGGGGDDADGGGDGPADARDGSEPADPEAVAAASASASASADEDEDEDTAVRLKVRDALLAAGSRGPLPGLLGARNYARAALDVLGAFRSELVCRQTGLLVLEAALEALFPEMDGMEWWRESAGEAASEEAEPGGVGSEEPGHRDDDGPTGL